MPEWGAEPPELNSAGFWFGPGSSSFVAAAENLVAVAAGLIANLGGQEAINSALAMSWPDPTGQLAVLSKVPLMLWQAAAAGQIEAQAAVIHEVALAFETLKAATPTPGEIGENQVEHGTLQANNFLGMLTPAIGVNRANYGRMWVTAASNKYEYAAASMPIQALPPLPPPPPATATGGATPSMPAPQEKASDLLGGGGEGAMNAFMGPLGQIGGMAGQLGQGGPLSSLSQFPQQAMQPLMSLLQGGMGGNPADALASATTADWLTATPAAGGPVAANLVGGGGAGGGGGGLGGGIGALRGPASFGSSPAINAASSTPESALSRVNEARLASGAQVSGAGMGSSGAMMGPMGHAAAGDQNKEEAKRKNTPLTSLAALYRAPAAVPVITGGGGAVFRPGEGVGERTT
ncbi:PPE family protein [Mycolicibacterium frederiksbergense]|uniref:PPE family protein n=1 Tax=Mycolicibacterium frederiksbergense TaxID=117567 RepID=A0A6H0RY91_9MYCO|nr:PPE domain-containing protein [Mycolicibacterium frederiksbergense]QIV79930.1 PPE family protein [Mycolicibacterium frederiksbergense]